MGCGAAAPSSRRSTGCRMSRATAPSRCCTRPSRRCLPRPPQAYGPRDAAVFVDQDKRFTWNELVRDGRRAGGRPAGARPQEGRPHRHLVAEPLGMAGDAIRHRPHRPGAGQHQPGLSPDRAGICAQQGRLPRADQRRPLQDLRLSRHDRDAGAGARDRRAGQARGGEAAEPRDRHPHGRREIARHVQFRRRAGDGRPRRA